MKTSLVAGVLALTLSGCATIISGSNQVITVNSDVPGAQVTLNGAPLGLTPLIASIKRGQEGVLSVQMPGYVPFQAPITKKVNGIFFVNILSGGVFGSSTDYSTGAMYAYEPDAYFVTMAPVGMAPPVATEWKRKEDVRAFVLLNSEALARDLANGQGEHVDALAELLQVEQGQRGAAVKRWRASYGGSKTTVAFADLMIAELPAPN
jgi:hypothetical protein